MDSLHVEKEPEGEDEAGSWIFTFADMISLLFAFFVILYTMSKVDQEKYQKVAESLKENFSVQKVSTGTIQLLDSAKINKMAEDPNNALNFELNNITSKINAFIYKEGLQTKISTFIDDRGVIIKIADDVFFDAGSAEISSRSKQLLNRLAALIKEFPYPLRVEGHTDNSPIKTTRYPTNWELSTGRACNVVRFLIEDEGISPRLFSAEGFGEYRPIASNDSSSGKAKNRRVELIYKKDRIQETLKNESK